MGAVGANILGQRCKDLVQGPRPQICWHRLSWWEMLPVKGWPSISCASVCTPASPVSASLYRLMLRGSAAPTQLKRSMLLKAGAPAQADAGRPGHCT